MDDNVYIIVWNDVKPFVKDVKLDVNRRVFWTEKLAKNYIKFMYNELKDMLIDKNRALYLINDESCIIEVDKQYNVQWMLSYVIAPIITGIEGMES